MNADFPTWKNELPGFPHQLVNEPLRLTVEFHLEHIRRDSADGRLQPSNLWLLLRGLLLGAMQGYASVCLLLSAKRPKPLMLQAGIINRSMFETLVNGSALLEDPGRVDLLNKESFKHLALRYRDNQKQYGDVDKWKDFLAVFRKNLESSAGLFGIATSLIDNPDAIVAEWPTPGRLIFGSKKGKVAPWVSGNRQEVLGRLYRRHYPHQSALAHQRIAAVSAAVLVDNPEFQWNPGHGESNLVVDAALFLLCIVSELHYAAGYENEPRLAETWTYLREINDDVQELWDLRYGALVSKSGV